MAATQCQYKAIRTLDALFAHREVTPQALQQTRARAEQAKASPTSDHSLTIAGQIDPGLGGLIVPGKDVQEADFQGAAGKATEFHTDEAMMQI